jgi:alpha-L-arabinofuranosidase
VSATRDDGSGDVILKLVNVQATAQPLQVNVKGVATIRRNAAGEVLAGTPTAVNTVAEPRAIVPRPFTIADSSAAFTHELPAHSVTVIRLKTR